MTKTAVYCGLILGAFIIIILLYNGNNKDEQRCKNLGGVYKSFYASENICFRTDALIQIKK